MPDTLPAKPRQVIWDWNGTLLDDAQLSLEVADGMRRRRGMEPMGTLAVYRRLFFFPIYESYLAMGYTFTDETYEEVAAEYHAAYNARVQDCPIYREAPAVLAAIREKGIRQAIVSASRQDRLNEQVTHAGIAGYFDGLYGLGDELAASKQAIAERLVASLPYAREEILFVGDSTHDAAIAKALGCPCVLLTTGHQDVEALSPCGVPLIASLEELLPLLG